MSPPDNTHLPQRPPSERPDAPPCLRPGDVRKTIWLTRPDIRALCAGDREKFEWWLITSGHKEYQAIRDIPRNIVENILCELDSEAWSDIQPPLTRFMRLIWENDDTLRSRFDIASYQGQTAYVRWYFTVGVWDLGFGPLLTDQQRECLNAADESLPTGISVPITRAMLFVWLARTDLQRAFPLTEQSSRRDFLAWYFTYGLAETKLVGLVDRTQATLLLRPEPDHASVASVLYLVWLGDGLLQHQFPSPAEPRFAEWAWSEGRTRRAILERLHAITTAETVTPSANVSRNLRPAGFNLVGYARGQFGIGEDVRMAALAMQAAQIPFSIYNVEPGKEVCQGDHSVEAYLSDKLPYAINLICTTGIETARLAAIEGPSLFDGRLTIGYWPWELPEWPAEWRHAFDLVDELWASSTYTQAAFATSTTKPVHHMPMVVSVDDTAGLGRRDLDLPDRRFLFVFSFDFLSSLARKNPQACIQAFRQAFPRGDELVGLVIKVMRALPDNPEWAAFADSVAADDRIVIITGTLTRAEVLDLYRVCDCFVSLHRAEGFGRGLAEAMLLGKPVIATGFSGNLDFTTSDNAALVPYRIVPLGAGDYPFGFGQSWAEPAVAVAAIWMRRIATELELRRRLSSEGQKTIAALNNPLAIGAQYRAALTRLLQ